MNNPIALYIHIPFCEKKCIYCDFYSVTDKDLKDKFIDALKKEIAFYNAGRLKNAEIRSIYFGGGTPTCLTTQQLKDILIELNPERFDKNIEITAECNPGTVSARDLSDLRKSGFNRLSIGVQSFDNKELKLLSRIHDAETAIKTIEEASKAGFDNLNLDLIFNLPGQTKKSWIKNLEIAAGLPVNHISAYNLGIEKNTPLFNLVKSGKIKVKNDDFAATLYETTNKVLSGAGFGQYEISNYALHKTYCRHNLTYWNYEEYIGLGPSAHSFVSLKRWWNVSSVNEYINLIEKGKLPRKDEEILTSEDIKTEVLMLALRSTGLRIGNYVKNYDISWFDRNKNYINSLTDAGLIIRDDDNLKLTNRGYFLCNEILSKFK